MTRRAAAAVACLGLAFLLSEPPPAAAAETRTGVQRRLPVGRRAEVIERRREARLAERPVVVSHLEWQGNRALSDRELQSVAFTHGPDWRVWRAFPEFFEQTLIGDMSRVESLYQLHGYYEAKADYSLRWNHEQTHVGIYVQIEEGPFVVLRTRTIVLPESADFTPKETEALLEDLPLQEGERFSAERYARTKRLLLDRLAEIGRPAASIRGGATVDLSTHEAVVDWQLLPGPLVRFGRVRFRGLNRVDERTARRELKIVPGERYSTKALTKTRRGLQGQGVFSWVAVGSEPLRTDRSGIDPGTGGGAPDEETWPVTVRVTERPPYSVDFGVGYNSDATYQVSGGWRHHNFLGDARKLRFRGAASGILDEARVQFIQPYFIDPSLSLILETGIQQEKEPAYRLGRVFASAGISRPIIGPFRGRITYDFSYQNLSNTTLAVAALLGEPLGRSRTAVLELGVRHQRLDDLLDPTRGTWLDIAAGPSLRELGSDWDYVIFVAEARGFVPLFDWAVLAGRIQIGSIEPIRGTTPDDVPVFSRFFAGGSNSHRGFQYNRMPPANTLNFNIGGTSSLLSSAELRVPLTGRFGAVTFVDAGVLDLNPWSFPLGSLFWAVGLGIRYDTLVGPLRFDYGILLNPPAGDSIQHEWFISVGHAF